MSKIQKLFTNSTHFVHRASALTLVLALLAGSTYMFAVNGTHTPDPLKNFLGSSQDESSSLKSDVINGVADSISSLLYTAPYTGPIDYQVYDCMSSFDPEDFATGHVTATYNPDAGNLLKSHYRVRKANDLRHAARTDLMPVLGYAISQTPDQIDWKWDSNTQTYDFTTAPGDEKFWLCYLKTNGFFQNFLIQQSVSLVNNVSVERCNTLHSWLTDGVLTQNLGYAYGEANACATQHPEIWNPDIGADYCREVLSWSKQGKLTENISGDVATVLRTCKNQHPEVWYAGIEADYCKTVLEWFEQGKLTENLGDDSGQVVQACRNQHPEIWGTTLTIDYCWYALNWLYSGKLTENLGENVTFVVRACQEQHSEMWDIVNADYCQAIVDWSNQGVLTKSLGEDTVGYYVQACKNEYPVIWYGINADYCKTVVDWYNQGTETLSQNLGGSTGSVVASCRDKHPEIWHGAATTNSTAKSSDQRLETSNETSAVQSEILHPNIDATYCAQVKDWSKQGQEVLSQNLGDKANSVVRDCQDKHPVFWYEYSADYCQSVLNWSKQGIKSKDTFMQGCKDKYPEVWSETSAVQSN